jgi:hypothetical protein
MQMYGTALRRRCAFFNDTTAAIPLHHPVRHHYVSVDGWCNAGCEFRQYVKDITMWESCNRTTAWGVHSGRQCTAPGSMCVLTDGSDVTIVSSSPYSNRKNEERSGPLNFLGFEYVYKAILTVVYVAVGDAVVVLRDRLGDATNFWATSVYIYVLISCTVTPFTSMLTSVICSGLNSVRDQFFRNKKKRGLKLSSLRRNKKANYSSNRNSGRRAKDVEILKIKTSVVEMVNMKNVIKSGPIVEEKEEKKEEVKSVQSVLDLSNELKNEENMEVTTLNDEGEEHETIHQNQQSVLAEEFQQQPKLAKPQKSKSADNSTKNRIPVGKNNEGLYRNCLTSTVLSRPFELFVMAAIIINSGFLLYEAFLSVEDEQEWIIWVEVVFSIIFVLEMIAKMIGLSVWKYFQNKWNVADFVVVIFAILVSALEVKLLVSSNNDFHNNVDDTETMQAEQISALISLRALRLFRISRVTRVIRAASMFGALRRLTDLVVDTVVSVLEVQLMVLLAVAVTALAMSTRTGSFGDNGLCTAGNEGILQFLNFRTFTDSYVTLSLTMSWNYIFEIFHGCLTIQDTTDTILYVGWLVTVVALGPKLITAIVVANFEASDRERKDFVTHRQYYLEQLHLQELKFTRSISTLNLASVKQVEVDQLETISIALMRLKVSVLNRHGGFPSHDVRHLHVMLTSNILNVRLLMLEQSLYHSFAEHPSLHLQYEILKQEITYNLRWCALRPMDQLDFVLGLLEIVSSILFIEATGSTRSWSSSLRNVKSSNKPSFMKRRSLGAFKKVNALASLVKIMGDNNDNPPGPLSRTVTVELAPTYTYSHQNQQEEENEEKLEEEEEEKKEVDEHQHARVIAHKSSSTTHSLRSFTENSTKQRKFEIRKNQKSSIYQQSRRHMEELDNSDDLNAAHIKEDSITRTLPPSSCKCQRTVDLLFCVDCYPRDKGSRGKISDGMNSVLGERCTMVILFISFLLACIPSTTDLTTMMSVEIWCTVEIIFLCFFFLEINLRWFYQWDGTMKLNAKCYVLLLDTLVVVGMLICLPFYAVTSATGATNLLVRRAQSVSISRAMRACRTLRYLYHSPRTTAVVNTVCSQGMALINVIMLLGLIFTIYSITGGFLFADDFHQRRNVTTWCRLTNNWRSDYSSSYSLTSSNSSNCDLRLIDELTVVPGYGDFHSSIMTLIQLSTLDNLTLLYMRLSFIRRVAAVLYVISFLMVVPFFLSNFFVAIFAMTVTSAPGRNTMLSKQQNHYVARTHDTYGASPVRGQRRAPTNYFQRLVFVTVCDPDGSFKAWFQVSVSLVLFVDMLLALSVPQLSVNISENQLLKNVDHVLRILFFAIYFIEIMLKLIALGPKIYLCSTSKVHLIDTSVVMTVVLLWLLSLGGVIDSESLFYTALLKARYFRLITHLITSLSWFANTSQRTLSTIKKLTEVVTRSFAALMNVVEVWFLITLVWSVVGVAMFARSTSSVDTPDHRNTLHFNNHTIIVPHGYSDTTYGINGYSHFDDMPHAFLTLIRMATIDHWSELYRSCVRMNPSYSLFTSVYFVLYLIVTGPILKSLSIAVLYSQFSRLKSINDGGSMLSDRDKESFQTVWLKYDPKGGGYIPLARIEAFLLDLRRNEIAERRNAVDKNKQDPRLKLMSKLKKHQVAGDAEGTTHRFTHRMLVPRVTKLWINHIVKELEPYRRNIIRQMDSIEGSGIGESAHLGSKEISPTLCWGRSKRTNVFSVAFSRVLILLVQKRLHEQAGHLQKHFKQQEGLGYLHEEDRIEATRCPVCKLKEKAMMELGEILAEREAANKALEEVGKEEVNVEQGKVKKEPAENQTDQHVPCIQDDTSDPTQKVCIYSIIV